MSVENKKDVVVVVEDQKGYDLLKEWIGNRGDEFKDKIDIVHYGSTTIYNPQAAFHIAGAKHENVRDVFSRRIAKECYELGNDCKPYAPDGNELEYGIYGIRSIRAPRIAALINDAETYKSFVNSLRNKTPWLPPKYEIISFDEMGKASFEDNGFIDGLCNKGGSIIIAGASGIGKSCMVNLISLSVACPESQTLFDRFTIVKPGNVLIVQAENSLQATAVRIGKLCQARPDLKTGINNVYTLKVFGDNNGQVSSKLDDKLFQDTIAGYVKEINATMVVIDPWSSFNPTSENSNEDTRQALEEFQEKVCAPTRATLLLVHHTGKNGAIRGASSLHDWAETVFIVRNPRETEDGGTDFKLIHDKCRNFPKQSAIELHMTSSLNFVRKNEYVEKCQIVIDILKESEVANQKCIKDIIMRKLDCSEASSRRIINLAIEKNLICTSPRHEKGNIKYYRLT